MDIIKSKPDGYLADGTPIYLCVRQPRGSSKSWVQLEIYRTLAGISDEEWVDIVREYTENLKGETL